MHISAGGTISTGLATPGVLRIRRLPRTGPVSSQVELHQARRFRLCDLLLRRVSLGLPGWLAGG